VTGADGLRFCGMMRNMPDLPNESASARYRRLAQECLEVARTFPDGERRTVLLQMAQVWLRLAQEQSGNETLDLGEGVSAPPTATAGGGAAGGPAATAGPARRRRRYGLGRLRWRPRPCPCRSGWVSPRACTHKSAFCKHGPQCPLCSDSDRSAALPGIDAMCHSRHNAPQQKHAIRSPRRRGRGAGRARLRQAPAQP
jgi:hypothetical protein